jgi:hypothetical protein
MTDNKPETPKLEELVERLGSTDPVARETSREKLVEMGGSDVTRALVRELVDSNEHVRWEAAKALSEIADPVAAPGLMHALEDDNEDVRWLAAEGLVSLGEVGLVTTLSGLIKRARSIEFCKSAHHVMHHLAQQGHADIATPVLEALQTFEPEITAPTAAYKALRIIDGYPS